MRRRGRDAGADGGPRDDDDDDLDSQAKQKKHRDSKVALSMIGGLAVVLLALTAVVVHVQKTQGVERETPYPSDVLVVSFPKSGSNWLRFLLISLLVDDHSKLTFPMVERLVPDLEYGPSRFQFKKGSRVAWKSHQPYRADAVGPAEHPRRCNMSNMENFQCLCPNCPARWRRIVHLVRDGRSALCSYYVMQTQLGNFDGDFAAFLDSPKSTYGLPWPDHVASYADNPYVFLLKYEDLHEDPVPTLHDLYAWLVPGKRISDHKLQAVVDSASFDAMRQSELHDGMPVFDANYPDAHTQRGFRLVREGKLDGWRHCTNDSALFDAKLPNFASAMHSLGYYDADHHHHL